MKTNYDSADFDPGCDLVDAEGNPDYSLWYKYLGIKVEEPDTRSQRRKELDRRKIRKAQFANSKGPAQTPGHQPRPRVAKRALKRRLAKDTAKELKRQELLDGITNE